MAGCIFELDARAAKSLRAAARRRHILRKQAELERRRAAPAATSPVPRRRSEQLDVKPHRMSRAAARSYLARGVVDGHGDMPSIVSLAGSSRSTPGRPASRKPSVAPLAKLARASSADLEEWQAEVDAMNCGGARHDTSDVDTSASIGGASIAQDLSESDCPTPGCDTQARTTGMTLGRVEPEGSQMPERHVDSQAKEVTSTTPVPEPEDGPHTEESEAAEHTEAKVMSAQALHREKILHNVAKKLHALSAEERRRADEAEASRESLESKLRSMQVKSATGSVSDRKAALQLERKRAAEVRKRRTLEERLRLQKDEADRKVQEAKKIAELAEAEAIAAKAQKLAEAGMEAQRCAHAFVLDEITSAQQSVEEMAKQRAEEATKAATTLVAEARAEALEIKAKAESDMAATGVKSEDMKIRARAEAEASTRRATVEARVIRAKAELELCELASQQEPKSQTRRPSATAATDSEQRASDELAAAPAAARRRAEAAAQRQNAATLKAEKELERRRAKQFRKQAEQERRREQERLQARQALQAQAAEEAGALRRRALEDALAIEAKSREEAQALQARVAAQAQRQASALAEAALSAAEARAAAIRGEAEAEAEAWRERLERGRVDAQADLRAAPEAIVAPICTHDSSSPVATTLGGAWELVTEDEEDGWSVLA